jgi:hypothetical protein
MEYMVMTTRNNDNMKTAFDILKEIEDFISEREYEADRLGADDEAYAARYEGKAEVIDDLRDLLKKLRK